MPDTTELAELLKRIAKKYQDKFTTDGPEPSIVWIACSGLSGVFIGWLDEIDNFTLDHMDAIAGALGMEFEVRRIQRHCWAIEVFDDVTPISGDLDDSKHPTKRSASIAALIAILKYKLGEQP